MLTVDKFGELLCRICHVLLRVHPLSHPAVQAKGQQVCLPSLDSRLLRLHSPMGGLFIPPMPHKLHEREVESE